MEIRMLFPHGPMASAVIEVAGDGLSFFVFDRFPNALVVASSATAKVDERYLLTREEWEEEFGGVASFDTLIKAVAAQREVAPHRVGWELMAEKHGGGA